MHASPRRAAHERASICRSNRAVAADGVHLFWCPVGGTGKHFLVMPCGVVYCRPGTPRASVATSADVVTDVAPARSPLASNGGPVRLCPRTRQASVATASLGWLFLLITAQSACPTAASSRQFVFCCWPPQVGVFPQKHSSSPFLILGLACRCSSGSHRRLWRSSLHQHRRPRCIICCSPAHGLPVVDSPARARVRRHRREMD